MRSLLVRTAAPIYRFGPFQFDAAQKRLVRGGTRVSVPGKSLELLIVLLEHAGEFVPKETIFNRVWGDVSVTDNTIVQTVRHLRKSLGKPSDGDSYIQTRARHGYGFIAPVERVESKLSRVDVDALLEPYLAFVDGRAALETLDWDAASRALETFALALGRDSSLASAHVGMANARLLVCESARTDIAPDLAQLASAERHERESCRLDPASADAWGTLALVQFRRGDSREALAAARKAIALEEDDWRHHLRLAWVSWGEERLRAARHALELSQDLALARWFAASVLVARQRFDDALDELRPGCALQDAQREDREAPSQSAADAGGQDSVDMALALAASLALADRHDEAAAVCARLLASAEPGSAGWLLPVEPLLRPTAHGDAWAAALRTLRLRSL